MSITSWYERAVVFTWTHADAQKQINVNSDRKGSYHVFKKISLNYDNTRFEGGTHKRETRRVMVFERNLDLVERWWF